MILHIDMDAFYASIEERDRPALRGMAVIVGGDRRGVVSAANYEARKFGVHSAMPSVTAKRLCPHAVFLPVRMDHYAAVARQIRAIFDRYTPLVEPLSLDEAFLDVAGCESLFGPPAEIGRRIKQDIQHEVQLTASVGIAPTKFVAKIASDIEKPNGFVYVEPHRVREFLDPLPVGRLWGVGKVTGRVFDRLRIHTIGQLRQLPLAEVRRHFGNSGEHFWNLAHGIDDRRVVPDREARSISHETTFPDDVADAEIIRVCLMELTDQVARRLRRQHLQGRTVNLKIRYADFHTITRSITLPEPTDITHELWQAAVTLLDRLPAERQPIRLVGVGASGFTSAQKTLFEDEDRTRHRRLDEAADKIRGEFGPGAISRGASLRRGDEEVTE